MTYTINLDPATWAPVQMNQTGRPRLPREHGTERGYQQHRHDGTRACGRCLYAHQIHNTERGWA